MFKLRASTTAWLCSECGEATVGACRDMPVGIPVILPGSRGETERETETETERERETERGAGAGGEGCEFPPTPL